MSECLFLVLLSIKTKEVQAPSIPKGTRDFGPEIMVKRNFIFDTIKAVYQKFGFAQLETPAMENLTTLTGKYGDEGDQLLFKLLNSGDFLKKASEEDFNNGSKKMLPKIAEKGLKYDLTVPFARYVVKNQGNISFPFKRFQIQPVWRADKPQKGRYREFYQCDADVIGTDSLLCEAEIVLMINEVFDALGLDGFTIKINNRKILTAISEVIGAEGKESDFCVAIDKLDKIGKEKVLEEFRTKGFSESSLSAVEPIFEKQESLNESLSFLEKFFENNETGKKGIEEIKEILDLIAAFGLDNHHLELDITLARGLSYYTGSIFEVKANDVNIGSICGGGRYDDLTGMFGMKNMSGVGISFGVDRIFDVLEELQLFPQSNESDLQLMIVNFGKESLSASLGLLKALRSADINAELYPDAVKMKKQMNYANQKSVGYVVMIGENEIKEGKFTLKNMTTGDQHLLSSDELIETINN